MDQKTITIGEDVFCVAQLDAFTAIDIQMRLLKILGPSIDKLLPIIAKHIGKKSKEEITLNIADMLPVISDVSKTLEIAEINDTMKMLFEKNVFIQKKGANVKFSPEFHFKGRIFDMWKLIFFIIKVNFIPDD